MAQAGAENSAAAASIAGDGGSFGIKKRTFYWVFRGGTAFADQSVSKYQPRDAAFFGVPLCCLPLALRRR
jgi:hypothetical protein